MSLMRLSVENLVTHSTLHLLMTLPKNSLIQMSTSLTDSRDDDGDEAHNWIDGDPIDPNTGEPSFENSSSDSLVNCEVLLPQGEEL